MHTHTSCYYSHGPCLSSSVGLEYMGSVLSRRCSVGLGISGSLTQLGSAASTPPRAASHSMTYERGGKGAGGGMRRGRHVERV